MKKLILFCLFTFVCFSATLFAQIPVNTLVQIVKAEDERRFDATLETLLKSPDAKIRTRAALAAGRIGNDAAIPALAALLEKDERIEVRTMAAFAIGEIESINGADAISKVLKDAQTSAQIRARAVEAAGKIAAANAKDEKSKTLGAAILEVLEAENKRGSQQNREVVLLGITAALRVRPEKTDAVVAQFLTNADARIRTDAGNTLARVRAKNANEIFRKMLSSDDNAEARANAARALGAAEDKTAVDILLRAAIEDEDSRVRVSAIRSLGSLKEAKSAEMIILHGEHLLENFKKSKFTNPNDKSELLEIATALGRILQAAPTEKAVAFLSELRETDKYQSAETEIALVRVFTLEYPVATPDFKKMFAAPKPVDFAKNWRTLDSFVQGFGEAANVAENENNKGWRDNSADVLRKFITNATFLDVKIDGKTAAFVMPNALTAFAGFKSSDLPIILRGAMLHKDVYVRAAAAGLLAETASSKETVEVLKKAFINSILTDKRENDAQLAILDALYKLDKKESASTLLFALQAADYLVRIKAVQLIKAGDFAKDLPGLPPMLADAKTTVQPYAVYTGTKLGQVLNTNADYVRAVSRKNGTVKAILTTEKGAFTIELTPEDAPLTVDNFIKLAKSGYFNGLQVHRVVPNFVMQDGDPRGDGNGGPGWSIRCELNMLPYERGAVGMALSGKDTGGSQWFVTHSPQPHLDGGYTVFGSVNESDMKIVDKIVRGDKILSVKIIEGKATVKR